MTIFFELTKLHPLYEVLQMLSWPWKAIENKNDFWWPFLGGKKPEIRFPNRHFWFLCLNFGGCTPLEITISDQWKRKPIFPTTFWMGTVSCKERILTHLQNVRNVRWAVATKPISDILFYSLVSFFPNHGSRKWLLWRQTTHLLLPWLWEEEPRGACFWLGCFGCFF